MTRIATCLCGDTMVSCEGEPLLHAQCSCRGCQKMTGAPSAYWIYYPADKVRSEGDLKPFKREATLAKGPTIHNCIKCGSTAFAEIGWAPEVLGLEVRAVLYGSFEDPDFDAPKIAVWNRYLPSWLESSAPAECTMEEQAATLAEFRESLIELGVL